MHAESTPINGQSHAELFKMLADAVQDHIHTPLDADAVRAIIAEEVAKVRMPSVIEVHTDGGKIAMVEGAHRQLPELLELARIPTAPNSLTN